MGALAIATLLFLFAAISALSDWDGAQKTAQRVWGNLVGSGTTVQ